MDFFKENWLSLALFVLGVPLAVFGGDLRERARRWAFNRRAGKTSKYLSLLEKKVEYIKAYARDERWAVIFFSGEILRALVGIAVGMLFLVMSQVISIGGQLATAVLNLGGVAILVLTLNKVSEALSLALELRDPEKALDLRVKEIERARKEIEKLKP